MGFSEKFYEHLEKVNYTEIKGGTKRDSFLEIWVVQVDGRVFARSWKKSKRSWFTAFIEEGEGQLKFGDEIQYVTGKKTPPNDPIHLKINEAYLSRYNDVENLFYAKGISQPEYTDYTMEFFIKERRS